MLYKRPIIALTSLLDLLFILIFAYQMDIKTNADEYVQAEVEKRISLDIPDQDIPDQSELVAKLQVENQKIRNELEIVRKKAESIDEYKLQSEEYKAQRDQLNNELMSVSMANITKTVFNDKLQSESHKQQLVELKNELQQKERELVAAKQESESVKRQSKTDTKKDDELAKTLVGTWRESCDYFGWKNSEALTLVKSGVGSAKIVYYSDGKYYSNGTFKALRSNMTLNNSIMVKKGQSKPYTEEGTWWVKDGYLYLHASNVSTEREILFINQQEYKLKNSLQSAVGVRSR
jgi:hypothetical protein